MKLIIEDDEGRRTVVPILRDEVSIGRSEDSLVRLTEKNVSRKHGRLLREGPQLYVEDLDSFTGIRVNGERIKGKRAVQEGDLIQISEYDLSLQSSPDELKEARDGDDEPTAVPSRQGESAASSAAAATLRLVELPETGPEGDAQVVPKAQRPRLSGPGGEVEIDRTPLRIGRGSDVDLVIAHPSIARKHCKLSLAGQVWKISEIDGRSAVRVNGAPSSQLRPGDKLQLGALEYAFVASRAVLPPPPPRGELRGAPGAKGKSKAPLIGGALAGLAVLAIVTVFVVRGRGEAPADDAVEVVKDRSAERQAALRAADDAAAAHRYGEAVRHLQAASKAGATAAELRNLNPLQEEAKAEERSHELDAALAAQDFDRAQRLSAALSTTGTWYGRKAAEKADAVKSGYVQKHLSLATAAKDNDNARCLTESGLALAADAANAEAQRLQEICGRGGAAQASARETASTREPRPRPAPQAREPIAKAGAALTPPPAGDDSEARRLVNEGNQKLIAQDFPGAIQTFEKALSLKPGEPVLAGVYRSMGITYTREGNVEEGARYYKLYLPLCTNPQEKAYLQKVLDDYEARRK